MPPDPAQPALFSRFEVPTLRPDGNDAKARLAASLMIRLRDEIDASPDGDWSERANLVYLAVLQVVASGIVTGERELGQFWYALMRDYREAGPHWVDERSLGFVSHFVGWSSYDPPKNLSGLATHHDSSLRAWGLTIAWIVRARLSDSMRDSLLEAFGGNLCDHRESFALAYALAEDKSAFWATAHEFYHDHHQEQYDQRLAEMRDDPRGLTTGFRLGAVEARAMALVLEELRRI